MQQPTQQPSESLPDYKLNFFKEMEQLREENNRSAAENSGGELGMTSQLAGPGSNAQKLENNVIPTTQYNQPFWKKELIQTNYQRNHDEANFILNTKFNPEVGRKNNNIRSTPISEYSNAMHNKTVFVNPKNTSC